MRHIQKTIVLFIFSSFSLLSFCKPEAVASPIIFKGRIESISAEKAYLISAGSSATFSFTGTKCVVRLQTKDPYAKHSYVVLELDGKYIGRRRIETTITPLTIPVTGNTTHTLTVYKATEATTGTILFDGVEATIVPTKEKPKKKIEFIGDSITSGMGNDAAKIPCDTGEWYDQHNAYFAYGPVTARDLGVEFLLNSVSGIGMYRNWNDEHDKEAIMPDVYGKLYLTKDIAKPYEFGFNPNITCIALGTNDFSDGDGTKPRLPFNEQLYVANYIRFVKVVYRHSPDTQVVLINSPMVSGAKNEVFVKCLKQVQAAFKDVKKPIQLFTYSAVTPHGCGYHPDIADHKLMAAQLTPFLKKLLNEK